MSIRSRAFICLLAIVAQVSTPCLVLCQEVDGSVQIEFAIGDCCASPGTPSGEDSTSAPSDCFCVQDSPLSPSAEWQRSRIDFDLEATAGIDSACLQSPPERPSLAQSHLADPDPPDRSALLDELRTVVLLS